MIRWDREGHPHRSFGPHLLVLAAALALLAASRAGWLGAPGGDGPDLPLAVARAAIDPVTLLLAGLAGWWLLAHRLLLPALLGLGVVIGYGISFIDFADIGATAPARQVAVRILACLAVGYLANALRLWLSPPPPRF